MERNQYQEELHGLLERHGLPEDVVTALGDISLRFTVSDEAMLAIAGELVTSAQDVVEQEHQQALEEYGDIFDADHPFIRQRFEDRQ